jgi:hypothetical protein
MITIKTNKNTYEVPTNFDELTWNKYVTLVTASDGNIIERLKVATGIKEDELLELSITDLKTIAEISCYTDILFVAEKYKSEHYTCTVTCIHPGYETYLDTATKCNKLCLGTLYVAFKDWLNNNVSVMIY